MAFHGAPHQRTSLRFVHACIPRVLTYPWIAFDLPVSNLIGRTVAAANAMRDSGHSYYWGKALRNVNAYKLSSADGDNAFDLANLMCFGGQ